MPPRSLVLGLFALVALACADDRADAKAAAAADHLRIGELRELLTKADVEHADCKEKEDLVKRVLESSARELLPDIELDELVEDDEDGGEPAPSNGKAVEADEASEEAPATASSSEKGADTEVAPPPEQSAATDEAAGEDAKAAEKAPATASPGESKLSQSKVAGGDKAAAAAAESPSAAAAAAPAKPAQYTKAQLTDDLRLVQMMAGMGLANQMMEVLTRIAFGLADTDRDAHISRAEATVFATSHLKDAEPLAVTLGLSGGALALDNASAVDEVIGGVFAVCDANADDRINATEARATACRKHVYDLLVTAPQPAAPSKAEPGAAASKPTGGGATAWEDLLKGMGGQGGKGMQKPNPLFAPLERRLRRLQATVMRNLRQPNFNTFLAGLGVVALVLQQALLLDVPHVRHSLRGLVGNDVADFTNRLQNVGIGCMLAAGLARFD